MNQYDEEKETYWEVNCFDLANEKLIDLYGNTDNEDHIEILSRKAFEKGYDTIEVIKITKETRRYTKSQ